MHKNILIAIVAILLSCTKYGISSNDKNIIYGLVISDQKSIHAQEMPTFNIKKIYVNILGCDPNNELVEYLKQNNAIDIVPASKSINVYHDPVKFDYYKNPISVRSKSNNENGIIFEIKSIKKEPKTGIITVNLFYYAGPLFAGNYEYLIDKNDKEWYIVKRSIGEIS
ncbi:hypothetical protein HZA73_09770 [candidate division TA06 bacterium]|nr:hypothetical protein [candidate division TA06 bacterium]